MHEAKSRLSELIAAAEGGVEVVVARAGKPAVRLVPTEAVVPGPEQLRAKRQAFIGSIPPVRAIDFGPDTRLVGDADWDAPWEPGTKPT